MASWSLSFIPAVLAAVLLIVAAAEKPQQLVRRKPGEDVTLPFGVGELKTADWVVWSRGLKDVLASYIDTVMFRASERFQLDTQTGSLTIRNLSVNDTGSYHGQIINGNTTRRNFTLNVGGLISSPVTAETSPGRTYWVAVAVLSVFVLLGAGLLGIRQRDRDTVGPENV